MKKTIIFILALVLLSAGIIAAQSDDCAELQDALNAVADICQNMGRNQACYGNSRLDTTFYVQPDTPFQSPNDRTGLLNLESITTAPYNSSIPEWGVAVLNVQANLPNTLPGQSVVILVVGDSHIENAVSPDEAFVSDLVMDVDVRARAANVRRSPSPNGTVLGSVASGTPLQADARSSDASWVRVLSDYGPGWISTSVIHTSGNISDLPVVTTQTRTPMQAFTFSNGIGNSSCDQVPPSGIVVQGPKNAVIQVTVNGVDFVAGSTFMLRNLENNVMQVATLEGSVSSGTVVLPAGFTAFRQLDTDGTAPAGPWEDIRPLKSDELDELNTFDEFNFGFMHYPIEPPTAADIAQTTSAIQQQSVETVGDGGTAPSNPTGNCHGFAPTSPLGGMPFGSTTFYWDSASQAESYTLIIAADGQTAVRIGVTAPQTSASVFTPSLPPANVYTWWVEANAGGQVVCTTGAVTMTRDQPQDTGGPYGFNGGEDQYVSLQGSNRSLAMAGIGAFGVILSIVFYGGLFVLRRKRHTDTDDLD